MSHHISNNLTSTSSNNQADLTTAKADIVAIKAKTDFLSITQNVDLDVIETDTLNNKLDVATLNSQLANSVASTLKTNIDNNTTAITTNESNLTGVRNNTLSSTLKTAVDTNTSGRGTNAANITGILNNNIASTLKTAVDANSAKITTQWSNNGSEIYINENVGIKSSNPNCDLEIGDSGDVVRVRLNGANSLAVSSELIFTDALTNNLTPYFNGMGFQYDSDNNRLNVVGDGNDDATPTKYMTFDRANEFVGINDTSPDFRLDVNGDINTNEEFRYYGEPVPMIIAKTSLNSATVSTHRFGYGQGANNTGGSHTDNTFYMPDTNFKVAFRPTSSLAYIEIDYFMDRYFSGRNLYWALGTSSSQSSIIGKTITLARCANSEWTSRKEKVRIHLSGLTPYSFYVRYIFVKEIVILSDNTVGSNSSASWIHWGGYNSHSDGGGQTIGHYETDTSPQTPSNSDNFGALEATVYSVPSTFTTAASTINPFQYIGY